MGTLAVDNIQHTDGSSAVTLNNTTITTGTLGSGVTVEGTLNSNTTFSGDAGKSTAKAWFNFTQTTANTLNGAFNVSSVADNGTGDITVNFLTNMSNTTYSVAGAVQLESDSGKNASDGIVFSYSRVGGLAVGSFRIVVLRTGGNGSMASDHYDASLITGIIFGD